MKKVNVAVVGATGLVGQKLTELLGGMPNVKLRLFGKDSVGSKITLQRGVATVESCETLLTAPFDYALFMATEQVAAEFAPKLVRRGVVCIDNSSYFRLRRNVPLVVSCVNGVTARGQNLIANPNCSTIQTVVALNALKKLQPTKMTAVTYQSVSGAGKEGAEDLRQRRCYGNLRSFRHPIYDNLIPLIGQMRPDGFTTEERKLTDESRKILGLPRLKVNAFCVRVPISCCHGVFVNVRLKQRAELDEIREMFKSAPNVLLLDDPRFDLYPMPILLKNTKYVGVGRITRDPTDRNAINFFCVADNLLRGAAYNAYEIFREKLKEKQNCL